MDGVVELTNNISEADALLALHAKIKKNPRIQSLAKSHDIPIYITKTSSLVQITKAIRSLMSEHLVGQKDLKSEDKTSSSEEIDALEEARLAMEHIVIPHGESVELLPRQSHIISLQMDLIQKYQLQSEKVGKEPDLRLSILPFQTMKDDSRKTHGTVNTDSGSDDFSSTNGYMNYSVYSVDRLPILPDSLPESSD